MQAAVRAGVVLPHVAHRLSMSSILASAIRGLSIGSCSTAAASSGPAAAALHTSTQRSREGVTWCAAIERAEGTDDVELLPDAQIDNHPHDSGLGATISTPGVVQSALESPAVFAMLRQLLVRHKFLVLEEPGLTEIQQLRLGRLFGDVQIHPTAELTDGAHPEIFWISNVDPLTGQLKVNKVDATCC